MLKGSENGKEMRNSKQCEKLERVEKTGQKRPRGNRDLKEVERCQEKKMKREGTRKEERKEGKTNHCFSYSQQRQ